VRIHLHLFAIALRSLSTPRAGAASAAGVASGKALLAENLAALRHHSGWDGARLSSIRSAAPARS
jgi:hypothetical protein